MRQVDWLRKTLVDSANETMDLEKLKYLQTKTVPRVEHAISELESTLQKLAAMCDDEELDLNTATVDSIIQEAGDFITQVTRLYNENEGYAPGLTGLEKSLTEIKPFSAGSDVTVFEFIDKFNAYCLGTKKAKAYKLYHNYLSISIQAQIESFSHSFDDMITFLRSTYGKIEVISANLLAELERRKKPGDTDLPEHADSLLAIMTSSSGFRT